MDKIEKIIKEIGEDFSHAYLFESRDPKFVREVVNRFASNLFCQERLPCFSCPHCVKIKAGSHPDLIRISPEKNNIPIAKIRELTKNLHLAPLETKKKIIHIEEAQYMANPAQNALLKTLEEPPNYGMIILSVTNHQRLLPTIRSRCRLIRLGDVKTAATIDRFIIEELLTDVANGDIMAGFKAQEKFNDYIDEKEELLDGIEKYLEDLLLYKTTKNPNLLEDRSLSERALQNRMNEEHIMRVLDLLIDIREGFSRNVNFQLSMERIMIEMVEDKKNGSRSRCTF